MLSVVANQQKASNQWLSLLASKLTWGAGDNSAVPCLPRDSDLIDLERTLNFIS